MIEHPPRTAALVLSTVDGSILGALPALPVATPWWQDVAPVVEAFRRRHGFEAVILRLLEAEYPAPPGGRVTYLAEVGGPVAGAGPWAGQIADHPLRLAYARPGGPAADLAWARARMAERGLELTAPPVQIRTWNLSSLWRLPIASGSVWLKVVPPFFAHEGAVIAHLAAEATPRMLAHEGARLLMAESAGEDLYDAGPDLQRPMIELLVGLQSRHIGRDEDLLALGMPDWRGDALCSLLSNLAERLADGLDGERRAGLAAFVAALPRRLAALADCGPGDTLVHGDFHAGNFRGGHFHAEFGALVLHDWGDCGLGHPQLDQCAFLDRIAPADRDGARQAWREAWLARAPGMDCERAEGLIAPLAAARQALIYQAFLDAIEPSEHPYHAGDPAPWLARAVDLAHDF
ncbi:MAG TPA: aminoglycoside phosphotransferase family protein [Caulobacteraceae bacterium]